VTLLVTLARLTRQIRASLGTGQHRAVLWAILDGLVGNIAFTVTAFAAGPAVLWTTRAGLKRVTDAILTDVGATGVDLPDARADAVTYVIEAKSAGVTVLATDVTEPRGDTEITGTAVIGAPAAVLILCLLKTGSVR
jgi:hypothetical protein